MGDLYTEKHGIPHDAGVHVKRTVHYDASYLGPWSVKWYFLNHSANWNAKLKLLDGQIVWVAVRAIAAGDEITFSYGEPDPAWV